MAPLAAHFGLRPKFGLVNGFCVLADARIPQSGASVAPRINPEALNTVQLCGFFVYGDP